MHCFGGVCAKKFPSRKIAWGNFPGKTECQRGCDCSWPSGWRNRRAAGFDGVAGIKTAQCQARAGLAVRRRRTRRGALAGKDGMMSVLLTKSETAGETVTSSSVPSSPALADHMIRLAVRDDG